ncbi:hypothetical protein ES692_06170 [Psychroserpens burtonensis]|uniref:Phage portal protein n=1 Tax=Psychroserpens burtonensis TaxID=49278 RepID=A0A5C7BAF0_9FLAO|nr:hypothetical protein [Psychroserpens burtonensis]TXE18627.1 hypothetical protein ES692_06170 [Psychroserpens burtonensis]
MNTQRLNRNTYLSLSGNNLNYYEIQGRESTSGGSNQSERFTDWKESPIDLGEYKVIPYGSNNDIPQQIQEAVLANAFATRSLERKVELLIEQGPYVFTNVVDGTNYFRQPQEAKKLNDWLESFGHEELLHNNARDYYFQRCIFNKIYRSRSGRLNQSSTPAEIEHITAFDCRLAYKRTDLKKKPTHVVVGDWVKNEKKEMVVYPLFDIKQPDKYPVAIHYIKASSYGMNDYPLPDIYGNLDWIKNTTNTPKIFKAFTDNSLNIKWHIQSPAEFWNEKRKIIKDNLNASTPIKEYKEQMLEDLKTEILDSLSSLLSGVDNVGKFWHNEYVIKLIGASAVELGWKITAIEQKTKEWVESQVKMYDTAIYAMQAGVGVHASLLMVGADGKSDSGSEQLYAYVTHQKTATPMPEFYVCKTINDIIKARFNTKEKLGFYRTTPERQQDVSNGQRMIPTTTPART